MAGLASQWCTANPIHTPYLNIPWHLLTHMMVLHTCTMGTCEGRKLLRRLVLGLLRHTRACMDRLSLCLTFRIKARQQESLSQSHATQHCGRFHHSVGRTSSREQLIDSQLSELWSRWLLMHTPNWLAGTSPNLNQASQ